MDEIHFLYDLAKDLKQNRVDLYDGHTRYMLSRRIRDAADQLNEAAVYEQKVRKRLYAWCRSAGFSSGPDEALIAIIETMLSQHCDERSYSDLRATNKDDAIKVLETQIADLMDVTRQGHEALVAVSALECTDGYDTLSDGDREKLDFVLKSMNRLSDSLLLDRVPAPPTDASIEAREGRDDDYHYVKQTGTELVESLQLMAGNESDLWRLDRLLDATKEITRLTPNPAAEAGIVDREADLAILDAAKDAGGEG